ncbi:hypothetical protein [Bdellovibrio sp. NC01]|uniref:hypothetical protein n=1 Tax=Bdellovibrio sp. NC01 TaxID=2220073 RepID=UPI0011585929|nr:hypothetical protein [Bdellovibrio sp. NC01]QDK37970.1 hypothetical protein DOE51_10405 [Bdellovibrio sp. NC01]
MFTILEPADIRCKNCQHVGKSVVNNYYRPTFLISLLVTVGIVAFYCYGVPSALMIKLAPGLGLPVLVCFATFISKEAHSCPKCSSTELDDLNDK